MLYGCISNLILLSPVHGCFFLFGVWLSAGLRLNFVEIYCQHRSTTRLANLSWMNISRRCYFHLLRPLFEINFLLCHISTFSSALWWHPEQRGVVYIIVLAISPQMDASYHPIDEVSWGKIYHILTQKRFKNSSRQMQHDAEGGRDKVGQCHLFYHFFSSLIISYFSICPFITPIYPIIQQLEFPQLNPSPL